MENNLYQRARRDLFVGETRIPNALSYRAEEMQTRISKLEGTIQDIVVNPIPLEQRLLKKAREEMCNLKYAELDLSFLGDVSCEMEYKKEKIRLPKFGVFSLGEQDFSISLNNTDYDPNSPYFPAPFHVLTGVTGMLFGTIIGLYLKSEAIGAITGGTMGYLVGSGLIKRWDSTDNYEIQVSSGDRRLPNIFGKELIRTLEFSRDATIIEKEGGFVFNKREIPENTKKKYNRGGRGGDITFRSQVEFIVPQKTKKSIEEAKKYIGRQNLYFVAEVKPENWSAQKLITEDSLVVGLSQDKCYLVDSFKPTAIV